MHKNVYAPNNAYMYTAWSKDNDLSRALYNAHKQLMLKLNHTTLRHKINYDWSIVNSEMERKHWPRTKCAYKSIKMPTSTNIAC